MDIKKSRTIKKNRSTTERSIRDSVNAEWAYDRFPVICNLRIKIQKLQKAKAVLQIKYDRLNDLNCKKIYTDNVKSKCKELNEKRNSKCDRLREALVTSTK